jgi:hypothetical protein
MDYVPIVLVAIHAMSGVFWAGSTGAMANLKGAMGERIFPFQMGSAGVAIIAGIVLFAFYRGFSGSTSDWILITGIAAATVAVVVQAVLISPARAELARATSTEAQARPRIARANRIAAGLLSLTVATMVIAKYF